jgi:hypothetical protein
MPVTPRYLPRIRQIVRLGRGGAAGAQTAAAKRGTPCPSPPDLGFGGFGYSGFGDGGATHGAIAGAVDGNVMSPVREPGDAAVRVA